MSSSRTANSTRRANPGFRPIDTISTPRASPRIVTYAKRASTATPSHGRSSNHDIFSDFYALAPPPATEAGSSSKRSSNFPSIPAKRIKTNVPTTKNVPRSLSRHISGSEDELQILHERESKPSRSHKKPSVDARVDSYRGVERMMNSYGRASRSRSEPKAGQILVEAEKDELQDSPGVDEHSYSCKTVATSKKTPETFLSDTEDNDDPIPEPQSPTLPLSPVALSGKSSLTRPSSLSASRLRRSSRRVQGNRLQFDDSGESPSQVSQEELQVPDSQPSMTNESNDYANKQPKKSTPTPERTTDQGHDDPAAVKPQHPLDHDDVSDGGSFDFGKPKRLPRKNSLPGTEIKCEAISLNGEDYGPEPILSVENMKILVSSRNEHKSTAHGSGKWTFPFAGLTAVYVGDGKHVAFKGKREAEEYVVQGILASETELEQFRSKLTTKARSFMSQPDAFDKNPNSKTTSCSKDPFVFRPRCSDTILKDAYSSRGDVEARDACLNRLDASKTARGPRTRDKKEDVFIHDRWANKPFTKLYYVDRKIWTRPLQYPIMDPQRKIETNKATVDFDEVSYLEPDEWLNDSLIWFGLKYLFEHYPDAKQNVYYFNTYFYPTLTKPTGRPASKDGYRSLINYEAVQRWTSKSGVDIFKYRHIVVPINFDAHWFVAIIANVDKILLQTDHSSTLSTSIATNGLNDKPSVLDSSHERSSSPFVHRRLSSDQSEIETKYSQLSIESKETKAALNEIDKRVTPENDFASSKNDTTRPAIITLDSMGSRQANVVRNLKLYLDAEARARHNAAIQPPGGITARGIPQQTNGCDCGLFLLEYVDRFLQDPNVFVAKVLSKQMNREFWQKTYADELRDNFRELVLREGYKQNFPELETTQQVPVKSEPGLKEVKSEPGLKEVKSEPGLKEVDKTTPQKHNNGCYLVETPTSSLPEGSRRDGLRSPRREPRSPIAQPLVNPWSNRGKTETPKTRPETRGKQK